jgi:hypothetical protein
VASLEIQPRDSQHDALHKSHHNGFCLAIRIYAVTTQHNTTHTGAQNFPATVSIVRLFARRVDEALLKTAGPSDSSTRPFEERPPCLQPL